MVSTVILADDSATARMVIRRCFEIAGLHEATFLEGVNGREALELARENEVDLIISDLNMPEMDGSELLDSIKSDADLESIPVVMITSSKNEAMEAELLEKGALKVLSKPVSPAVIAGVLQQVQQ